MRHDLTPFPVLGTSWGHRTRRNCGLFPKALYIISGAIRRHTHLLPQIVATAHVGRTGYAQRESMMGARHIHSDTVRQLRRRYADGYRISELVEGFGLSRSAVHGIVRKKTHVDVLDTNLDPLATVEPRKSRERVRSPETPLGELNKYQRAAQAIAARRR